MSSTYKEIWDAAYCEEYDGLSSLPTWEVLSESELQTLSKGIKALPSMAIATIKYDNFKRPKCANYCIAVLGNHDYHTWSKESTAAPVLSQLELRLLTSIAIFTKKLFKKLGYKAGFCSVITAS